MSLILWITYSFILGPLWGGHLYDMGEWIIERAKFLQEHGQQPHPILQHYQALKFSDIWLGGSLYGALFLAWPMALYMALGEVLYGPWKGWLSIGCRSIWALGLFVGLGENIFAFADAVAIKVFAFGLVLACPYFVRKGLLKFSAKFRDSNNGRNIINVNLINTSTNINTNNIYIYIINIYINIKNIYINNIYINSSFIRSLKKSLPFTLSFLVLLPLLIHPVWSIWLTPERIDAKIKTKPLIRDMLLLNAQGESWINSWYYQSAPLLNEKERITSFQPMVVGLLGMEEASWSEMLRFGFKNPLHPQGQPIVFIKVTLQDDFNHWLNSNWLDYLAIDANLVGAFSANIDKSHKGSIGFYSSQSWNMADGFLYLDPEHYFRLNPKTLIKETPITRQRDILRQEGYAPAQSACLMKAAQRMSGIFNQPWTLMSIVVLMLWGLVFMIALAIFKLCQTFSWLALCLLLWTSPNIFWYREAYNYWLYPQDQSNFWSQVIDHHFKALRLSPDDLKSVLALPLSQDQRIAMLQVSILGRSFAQSTCTDDLRAKIVERFQDIFKIYTQSPLNFRYKVIDATANIPALRSDLEQLTKAEKHMYVRWYGAEHGLGISP